MRYYLGHWQWMDDAAGYYAMPQGAIAALDFAPLAVQGTIASSRPGGFFATPDDVELKDHVLIASGEDLRESRTDERTLDAFYRELGYRPQGDTLSDLLWDCLTTGADPNGEAFAKPLMPTDSRKLQVNLPGHGVIRQEKYSGKHSLAGKVVDVWRNDYRQVFDSCQRGEMPVNFHRRMLDHACQTFKTTDWQSLLPDDLKPHVAGRLPHNTIYQESFNTADGDTLGPDLTWTEVTGDIDIVSNKAQSVTNAVSVVARANHDLSSANHYVQATVSMSNEGAASDPSIMARKDSSGTLTFMSMHIRGDTDTVTIYKVVADAYTALVAVGMAVAASTDYVCKFLCDGSGHSAFVGGIARTGLTDTSITTGTRCGIRAFMSSGNAKWDSWSASDQLTEANIVLLRKSSVLSKL